MMRLRSFPILPPLGYPTFICRRILTARAGSLHGYDVVDASRVNPELGGEEALRRLVRELRRHGLGSIVDIVANHMAIGSGNPWWMNVLQRGEASHFARYFDINWTPDNRLLRGKIALPILGRRYSEALAAGEITLHRENGQVFVRYFDHVLPLAAESAVVGAQVLDGGLDPASESGRERLHKLLESQHYRLMWWRSANDEINWRRFFDINELAAVRVEDDDVFEAVHATIFRLYAEGVIDGLRIDHVDGLSRPGEYCRKLRQRLRSWNASGRRIAPTDPRISSWRKFSAAKRRCRQNGRLTAQPATTSWTRSARCSIRARRAAIDPTLATRERLQY